MSINGYPKDVMNMLSKLTIRKAWNIIHVFLSFHFSRLTRNTLHPAFPFSLSVEPTTSCNLRCPECPSGLRSFTRPTGMLEMDLFRKLIDQVHEKVFYLTFYFQGEPFLNPLFLDMVRYASEKKLYTATSTNAHYLSEETARRTVESGIDRVIISIDGTTQDTYSSYRVGGSLQKVLEGTNRLVYWKRKLKSAKPYLVFQFLVVRPNEHQIGEIRKLARETGVDKVVFKTAQIYDFESGNPLIPLNEKYSRYRMQKDGTYKLKNPLINHCWKLWHSSVLTWDGKIVPCCFDKDAAHVMGSLDQGSFKELWNSPSYREFRGNLFRNRSETEICRNCSEGAGVWTD